MTNLLTVLPEFDVRPYTHLLPSLEKALISTADLLTLDSIGVAKRASIPPGEVKKLSDAVLEALHSGMKTAAYDETGGDGMRVKAGGQGSPLASNVISTLDDQLDATLGGGIASRYLTEFVGER